MKGSLLGREMGKQKDSNSAILKEWMMEIDLDFGWLESCLDLQLVKVEQLGP